MAALKVLVVVMGVLIVGGVAAIVYGLVTRLDLSRPRFADGKLELPAGARVVDMAATGERLVLRVALPDAHERLIVVDLARGRQIGTLELVQP
jgi:uncharacterized membrane protein HdeD (DUF308 family)